jgi:CDP-2,3-bis-(O-geranylgeranyl)-sn-glycerol synthase
LVAAPWFKNVAHAPSATRFYIAASVLLFMLDLMELVLLVLPAWLANAVPVLLGGGPKLDAGAKAWDGKRWLGDSKTVNGLVSGIACGSAAGAVIAAFAGNYYLPGLDVPAKVGLAVLLSVGALFGDALGSFIKRRRNMPPGHPSLVLDKLLFIFAALALALFVHPDLWNALGWEGLAFVTAATYALHVSFNWLAHALKMKKVPW